MTRWVFVVDWVSLVAVVVVGAACGEDGRGAPADVLATGAACASGDACLGGTCLGVAAEPETGNPRFADGYCTTLGCTVDSQEGCGPDEWCVDGGFAPYCVELCSKSEGMTCERADHVCLGLGTWGGCFDRDAVECNVTTKEGCGSGQICVRIGFEDAALGRCETMCDPMAPTCADGDACYYIRRYNAAFCGDPGTTPRGARCTCDKCCQPGLACVMPTDRGGKICQPLCLVAQGCDGGSDGGTCVAYEEGSPWGGCFSGSGR